jgi:hypothetical protein
MAAKKKAAKKKAARKKAAKKKGPGIGGFGAALRTS